MGNIRRNGHLGGIGALALAFGCVSAAFAQDETESAKALEQEQAEDESARLPELLVTTQKIEQTLEQVPASVSALTGDQIRDSGGASFAEMQDYTANVPPAVGPAGQYSIRGLARRTPIRL